MLLVTEYQWFTIMISNLLYLLSVLLCYTILICADMKIVAGTAGTPAEP